MNYRQAKKMERNREEFTNYGVKSYKECNRVSKEWHEELVAGNRTEDRYWLNEMTGNHRFRTAYKAKMARYRAKGLGCEVKIV